MVRNIRMEFKCCMLVIYLPIKTTTLASLNFVTRSLIKKVSEYIDNVIYINYHPMQKYTTTSPEGESTNS